MSWPTTQVAVGDLVTATQLNQLPIGLAEKTGAAASYDFTSIPSFWTHLLLVCALQTGSGNNIDNLTLRLNNDSGARYLSGTVVTTDSTVTGGATSGQTSIDVGRLPGVAAGGFGAFAIWIPNYAVATNHTVVSLNGAGYGNSAGNNSRIATCSGTWFGSAAAAVNRVTLIPNAGSFVANSIATLYGMGAV